jgi:hypothetical protein
MIADTVFLGQEIMRRTSIGSLALVEEFRTHAVYEGWHHSRHFTTLKFISEHAKRDTITVALQCWL